MRASEIKELRKQLNLSQRELSEKIGISQTLISDMEICRSPVRPEVERVLKELLAGRPFALLKLDSTRSAFWGERRKATPPELCSRCLCWVGPTLPCGCP